tara:strand:+ start:124 stop:912 length:789 start_codon:yes stop_codon:yes gene_type:complete
MQGYIKINRAILFHPSLQKKDRSLCEIGAFIWILLEASFKERDFDIKGQTIKLKRGQLCCSISYMAKAFNWNRAKVQRYLDKLKAHGTLLTDTPNDTPSDTPNVLTVCHYDEYQDTPTDTPTDNKQNKLIRIKDKNSIDDFNTIWSSLRARRGSKKIAEQKYNKIKSKVDKDILIQRYNSVVSKASSPEYIPHFSTYLSQERWLDEDTMVKAPVKTSDQYFKETYPDKIPKGFKMIAETWQEIEYSDGKEYLKFTKFSGEKI